MHIRFGLPPKVPAAIKTLLKQGDRASAFFEATQLAGFQRLGPLSSCSAAPPKDYSLTIVPLPPAELAQ